MTPPGRVTVRRAEPGDASRVLAFLARWLKWRADDEDLRIFRWMHAANPFGPSVIHVAEAAGEIVAARAFLRWRLRDAAGERIAAARSIDVVTAADHRGEGLYRRLTQAGLAELGDSGCRLVFSTPNHLSAPALESVGATSLGRLERAVRPASLGWARTRLTGLPSPERRSVEMTVGLPAARALAGSWLSGALGAPPTAGVATDRDDAYLTWRYGCPDLRYRALTADRDAVIFRIRPRGRLRMAVICETLLAGEQADAAAPLRALARARGIDELVRVGPTLASPRRAGFLTAGPGPHLMALSLDGTPPPPLAAWHLTPGDLELF